MAENEDAFQSIEESKREYVRSIFTPAFYDPDCESVIKPIVKPIYYWPGETVALKCLSCIKGFDSNKIAKNWAIFQRNIPESINELYDTLKVDKYGKEQWIILDNAGAEAMRKNYTVKSYIPGTGSNDKTRNFLKRQQIKFNVICRRHSKTKTGNDLYAT